MPLVLPHHTLEEIPQLLYTELKKGLLQKKHPFRNVVFSTSAQETPMSRWVVCRQVTAEQGFYIYTDGRSQKILELNQNPKCNLLFYHDRQGLQIRFNCEGKIHKQNELTQKYWHGVKGHSAENYTTSLAPGTPIESIEAGQEFLEELTDEYFTLLELNPYAFEVVQLSREGHIRANFEKISDQNWKGSFLVP